MKKVIKYIPYATVVLGIIGATVEPTWSAGSVCCGIVTIITVFYVADELFGGGEEKQFS